MVATPFSANSVSDGLLWGKYRTLSNAEPYDLLTNMVVDRQGRVFTSGEGGKLVYYCPLTRQLRSTDLALPGDYNYVQFSSDHAVVDWDTAAPCNTELFGRFHRGMLDAGVWLPPSQFEAWFLSAAHTEAEEGFRFPVQWVCRPQTLEHHDFRGFAGRVEAGEIAVGDAVRVLPSGVSTRVKAILLGDVPLQRAGSEQSVTIQLADEVDVSRGDVLVSPEGAPTPTRAVEAVLCWLSERPLSPQRRYLVRHATRESKAQVAEIAWRMDLTALAQVPADGLAMNDIGRVSLRLAQPVAADPYRVSRATGAFIVVDEASNDTVGAGMIL